MNPLLGIRFGAFEITGRLGAGGMGEVYRARDTRLKREIALKVLPATFAADLDRVARFQREAELLATLSHPHIATVHGLEESIGSDGHVTRALVMELVDGETLADRVGAGALPVDDVVAIARQLADALDYAHEHGVLHRDLKPANLILTSEGQLKVLDFGLAKALAPAGADPAADRLANSPTITSPAMTEAGVLLGTAAYMSPEQARGRTVDKRADIWAYGCVLYELLTGRRAFEGETLSDTLASVLKTDPDWRALPATVPAGMRELIQRCLMRDLKARLRDIGEARRYLEAQSGPTPNTELPTPAPTKWQSYVPWVIAAGMGVALIGGIWRDEAPTVEPSPAHRFSIDLGAEVTLRTDVGTAAVLSPDGQALAFTGRPFGEAASRLYVRRLDQLDAIPLPGTDDAFSPFFSPDGRWIAFFAAGKLKKVETRGGAPVTVCDAPSPRGGTWTTDGYIVLLPAVGGGSTLHRVAAAGGPLTPFIEVDPRKGQRWPQMVPDGSAVIYTRAQPGRTSELVVQRLPAGERIAIGEGSHGRLLPSGHLVFANNGSVFAVTVDPQTFRMTGPPVKVLEGVRMNGADGAQFSLSDQGQLAYVPGEARDASARLEWLDAQGNVTPVLPEAFDWSAPQFSRDGRFLAYHVPGTPQTTWILDVERGARNRLPVENTTGWPAWTPDGRFLTFSTKVADGAENIALIRSDGSNAPRQLFSSPFQQGQPAWHPDGQTLAFQQATSPDNDIMVGEALETDSPNVSVQSARKAFDGSAIEVEPAFSRDGKWLAYTSLESGRAEVHVRAFPGPGGRVVVSTDGGRLPEWSRRENQLFFANGLDRQQVMVVDYTDAGGIFAPSPPRQWSPREIVWRRRARSFSLHPDGRRIVAQVAPEPTSEPARRDQLVFVTNFLDELRRVTPAPK